MPDLYPTEARYKTIGSTVYRWVGNLPDMRNPNGWARLAMIFPQTTKKSWQSFLRGCVFSAPEAFEGQTREDLEALEMIGAWKPEGFESEGYSISLDEGAGLFDFGFED